MASNSNHNNKNYPPSEYGRRLDQITYRIQHELNVLGKKMDQTMLDNAAKRAGEREREKFEKKDIPPLFKKSILDYHVGRAAEEERARLIGEERERRINSGTLNIQSREKFIPSLEERKKNMAWKNWDENQRRRMLAMDSEAATATDKELQKLYGHRRC